MAYGLVAAVVWSSLGPPPSALHAFSLSDKLLHLGAYGATTFAFLLAAVWRPGRGAGRFPGGEPWIVGAALGLAIAMELCQGAFTTRTADAFDVVAGGLGVAVAIVAWRGLRSRGAA